jgi:hypothetical protein
MSGVRVIAVLPALQSPPLTTAGKWLSLSYSSVNFGFVHKFARSLLDRCVGKPRPTSGASPPLWWVIRHLAMRQSQSAKSRAVA